MASISLADVRASDTEALSIISLITTIRQDHRFNCPIILAVECAPGNAASYVEREIRQANIPDVCVMSERKGYMEGVPKTEGITYEYVVEISRALSSGFLTYADEIVTYKPNSAKEPKKLVLKLKQRLKAMMGNLRKARLSRSLTARSTENRSSSTETRNSSSRQKLMALRTTCWSPV